MNKTLLTSAVLLALSSSSFAADFEHTGTLDLSNPPQGFDKSATYDNLTVTNTAVTENENGLRGNASMTLRVNNQLTISSVNGGITLNSENTDFVVNAPHITIKNVGALSGIHLDGAGSTVKVQNFKEALQKYPEQSFAQKFSLCNRQKFSGRKIKEGF